MTKYLEDNPPINYSDTLYSLSTFRETFGTLAIPSRSSGEKALPKAEEAKLSERDVEVLVRWLSRDAGVIVTDGKVNSFASTSLYFDSVPSRGNQHGRKTRRHVTDER